LVTVVAESEIEIVNDVTLDGEGYLTVALADQGSEDRAVFVVPESVTSELHGITVGAASFEHNPLGVLNLGTLTLADSVVARGDDLGIHNAGTLTMTNGIVWENGGIFNEGTMSLTGSEVSGNARHGAAIHNEGTATLQNSVVEGNEGFFAGGVVNSGTMTVTDSTIQSNTCDEFGCGGAGISNEGTMTLTNSTVSNNEGGDCSGIGNAGSMTLVNSTVSSGNPGICNFGSLTSVSSTVAGNTADAGGAIDSGDESTTTMANSIVDGDCIGDSVITSNGYNVQAPGDTCGFDEAKGDLVSVSLDDLNLWGFGDYGGPTHTHALRSPSVAIDLIPVERCVDADGEPLATDQRGEPRPEGDGCDAGAVEWQPGDPTGTD
jgi:hypothetical protein